MRTTISNLTLATVLLLAVAATAHDKVVVIPLIKHSYGPTSCSTHNDCSSGKCTTEGTCAPQGKFVFVSSATYDGDLGGLYGARSKCQDLAVAAGLPGTYMAWLSSYTSSPSNRFTHSTVPYVLVDGSMVAHDWDDLTDGSLDHDIYLDERANRTHRYVWTNTEPNGEIAAIGWGGDCGLWSRSDRDAAAQVGQSDEYGARFTRSGASLCDAMMAIYCFEQ